MTSLDYQWW